MTGLARRARRSGCRRVGLDRRGEAGLTVDRAAVAARVPSDGQADGRAAGVTFAVAIGIHMVSILITGIAAGRTAFCSAMLRFVVF